MRYAVPLTPGIAALWVIMLSGLSCAAPRALASLTNLTTARAPMLQKRVGGEGGDAKQKQKAIVRVKWLPRSKRYQALVKIGSKAEPMRVMIDTGSCPSWVLSKRLNEPQQDDLKAVNGGISKVFTEDSTTLKAPKKQRGVKDDLDIRYLSTVVWVNLHSDTIALQDVYTWEPNPDSQSTSLFNEVIKVESADIGLVKKVDGEIKSITAYESEGLLGLGVQGKYPSVTNDKYPSFFENAVPGLEHPVMKLKLPYNQDGQLSFGYPIDETIDIEKSAGSPAMISRSPIAVMELGGWILRMPKEDKDRSTILVVLDTGNWSLTLPNNLFERLYDQLTTIVPRGKLAINLDDDENEQVWVVCEELGKLSASTSKFQFKLGKSKDPAFVEIRHLVPPDSLSNKIQPKSDQAGPSNTPVKEEDYYCPLNIAKMSFEGQFAVASLGLPFFHSNVVSFEIDRVEGHHVSWAPLKMS